MSLASSNRETLTSNQKRFIAELVGTFVVVLSAAGSVVLDAKTSGSLGGIYFVAFAPFVGVSLMVYTFSKVSMAHFNPAVSVGYFITRHITTVQLIYYFTAEVLGALIASLFIRYLIGIESNLGATPNYRSFSLPVIFGTEVLATALLMAVILTVVYKKGLKGFGGLAIGSIVGLDILFFSFISGASMNPARSLAPALLSGALGDLWLYWSATFIGSFVVAFIFRKKLVFQK